MKGMIQPRPQCDHVGEPMMKGGQQIGLSRCVKCGFRGTYIIHYDPLTGERIGHEERPDDVGT